MMLGFFITFILLMNNFYGGSYFRQNYYLATPKGRQVVYALPVEEVVWDQNGRLPLLGADLTPLTGALRFASSTDPKVRNEVISFLKAGVARIKKIKVIALDLSGVVSRNGMVLGLQRLCKRLSTDRLRVSYDDLNDIFNGDDFFLWTEDRISEDEFWTRANRLFKQKHGVDLFSLAPKEEIRKIWFDAYEMFPGMEQLIRELRTKGYRVILFTNNTKEKFEHVRSLYDFDNLFDDVLNSADMGFTKLDYRIYDEMLVRMGVSPEEILYVDDVERFLKYPQTKGINTIWYSNMSETPLSEKAAIAELLSGAISELIERMSKEPFYPPIEVITSTPDDIVLVALDWDDTLFSGEGWREVELQQNLEVLSDGKETTEELRRFVSDYVRGVSGIPPLVRKEWLRGEAVKRGVTNVRTTLEYYNDYWARRRANLEKTRGSWQEKHPLIPGALELLTGLRQREIPMVIVTAGSRKYVSHVAAICGIRPFFDEIYGEQYEDTLDGQEIVVYTKVWALRRLMQVRNLQGKQIVFMGDGNADMQAAKEAGVVAAGVSKDSSTRKNLIKGGADLIINLDSGCYRDVGEIINILLGKSISPDSDPAYLTEAL